MMNVTFRPIRLVACLIVGSSLAAAVVVPAFAQYETRDEIALQNQISELRAEVQALADQVRRGGGRGGSQLGGGEQPPPPSAAPSDITATLLDRVSALEEQVRELVGRVQDLTNTQQQQYQDLNKKIDDLNFRLQGSAGGVPPAGEQPLTSPPPGSLGTLPAYPPTTYAPPSRPAPLPVAPPAASVRRTPELALQQGYAALDRRDYPAAEADAREIMTNYRTSPRAYDAQLLLARALTGERNYARAAIAYDDTYNRSHTGPHAPDALLGLAGSLGAIKERKAACDTLAKLAAEFPHARPDIRSAAHVASQRNACQ